MFKSVAFVLILTFCLTITTACSNNGPKESSRQPSNTLKRPSNLIAAIENGGVTLTWQDNNEGETGYTVYRHDIELNEATDGDTSYTELASLSANSNYYVDTDVVAGSSYRYAVAATRENDESAWVETRYPPIRIPANEPESPNIPNNLAPEAYDQTLELNEDSEQPIVLLANDGDGDTLTYSLVAAPQHGTLTGIESNTGKLSYSPNINYAGEDSFQFKVSDGKTDSNTATVNVQIAAVNDPPTAIHLSNSSISENLPAATVIGTLSADDVDSDTLTFSLVDNQGAFTIIGSEVQSSRPFDRETEEEFSLEIQVSDGETSYTQSFTISILDEDDSAPDLSMDDPGELIQNVPLTLTGTASDDIKLGYVKLYENDRELGNAVLNSGGWTFSYTPTLTGSTTLRARAFDAAGNSAEAARSATVLIGFSNLSTGFYHNCANGSDGTLYCWGANSDGRLGNGSTTRSRIPTRVNAPTGVRLSNPQLGYHHSCASGSDGALYCWGNNDYGQLGNGNTTASTIPVKVLAPSGISFSKLAISGNHNCAESSDGVLYCWGDNRQGQLGDGSTISKSLPTIVLAPTGITLKNANLGFHHSCAEGSNDQLYCWGANSNGRLGDGTTTAKRTPTPVLLPAGVKLTGPALGYFHSCAKGNDGNLYCWGENDYGQLGSGNTTDSSMPARVLAPSNIELRHPNLGRNHSCAKGSDSLLYCWGNNERGQLGDNQRVGNGSLIPIHPSTPASIQFDSVYLGGYHSCASGEASVYCWGFNNQGQLGNDSLDQQNAPIRVWQP